MRPWFKGLSGRSQYAILITISDFFAEKFLRLEQAIIRPVLMPPSCGAAGLSLKFWQLSAHSRPSILCPNMS